jgi:ubiquinone/menaquinone biosynthesis C-methylase UbiE
VPSATEEHYTSGAYWASRAFDDKAAYKVPLALRVLSDAGIALSPGMRAVEIGCGDGAFLFPLASALEARVPTLSLTGYDISSLAVERAQAAAAAKHESRMSFRCGLANEVAERFDVAFVMDVVEHVTDPYAFLGEVSRLAPVTVVYLPIEQSLAHQLMGRVNRSFGAYHHIHFFSMDSMGILLRETGLTIASMRHAAASPEIFHLTGGWTVQAARRVRYCAYRFAPRVSSLLMGGSVMMALTPAR